MRVAGRAGKAATVGTLGSVLALISGCGAPTGTQTTTRPEESSSLALPATSSPQNDLCVIGSWRSTIGALPQQVGSDVVTLRGGGGTVLTYGSNGSYSADFARTHPYLGVTRSGIRVALSVSGEAEGTFTAQAGFLSLADSKTTLLVTLRVSGRVTSSSHPAPTSSASYTCTAHRGMTLSSGGFATHYVPAA